MNEEISTATETKPELSSLLFFKCRLAKRLGPVTLYIAWCALIPMTDAGPCDEPAEPVWFSIGNSEGGTIKALKESVEIEIGKAQWIRQPATK